jgi:3-amino-5-hydroxybenzoate synthase
MTLAIHNGEPVRKTKFPSWPTYNDDEKNALIRALDQGQWWRVSGKEVSSFEREFAGYHGAEFGLAVTNGTQALEIALLAIGVQPNDEVIVPAFTFISTSMAVQRIGAIPVPVDVDLDTYNISCKEVKRAINANTRAVIPVHMAGQVANLEELKQIVEPHGIQIIQDAAHAHGAVRNNTRIGEWDTIACFSFQNFKLMTAGEGGFITFPSTELLEKAFLFHNCGREVTDKAYCHDVIGSNCRMNEFSAAVLRAQLNRLPRQNELRAGNAKILFERFNEIEGVIAQQIDSATDIHPFYMAMFRLDSEFYPEKRDFVVQALVAEGIPAFRNYKQIYRTKAFMTPPARTEDVSYWAEQCPNTEKISEKGIWIHHSVLLGDENDVNDVARAIQKVLNAC